MSHWNYRLIRIKGDAGAALILTEVYYDDVGKPTGYIAEGCTFSCIEDEEGRESIVDALMMAAKAAESAPILDASAFDDEKEAG